MRYNVKKSILTAVLFSSVLLFAQAQKVQRPAAPDISLQVLLERMKKASDPDNKAKTVKTLISKSSGMISMQQIAVNTTFMFKMPDKIKTKIRVKNIPATIEAYNGKAGWSMVEGVGVQPITGLQLEFLKLTAKMSNPNNDLEDIFTKITLDKNQWTVGKFQCYKLICSLKQSMQLPPAEIYVDINKYLPRKMVLSAMTAMGIIPTETVFGPYKKYNGLLLPSSQTVSSLGMTIATKQISVMINPKIKDSVFNMPKLAPLGPTSPLKPASTAPAQ
jgi:hypothetical protein